MSRSENQQPSVMDRHRLNNLQRAVSHQTKARISFIFHLLSSGIFIAALRQFQPREINTLMEKIFPVRAILNETIHLEAVINKIFSQFPEDPDEEYPVRPAIVIGVISGFLEVGMGHMVDFLNIDRSKMGTGSGESAVAFSSYTKI